MSVHVDAHSFWTNHEEDGSVTLNVGRYEEHADGTYYYDYTLDEREAQALYDALNVYLQELARAREAQAD